MQRQRYKLGTATQPFSPSESECGSRRGDGLGSRCSARLGSDGVDQSVCGGCNRLGWSYGDRLGSGEGGLLGWGGGSRLGWSAGARLGSGCCVLLGSDGGNQLGWNGGEWLGCDDGDR